MFEMDACVMRCRGTYIFLRPEVWFVPRLNLNEEVVFHVIILEGRVGNMMGYYRTECAESTLNLVEVTF